MDFIERFFGISPDGGSGSLEAMLLTLPLVIYRAGCSRPQRSTLQTTDLTTRSQ